jgi:hypothetical protein
MSALTLPLLAQWAPPSPLKGEGNEMWTPAPLPFGEREGPAAKRWEGEGMACGARWTRP